MFLFWDSFIKTKHNLTIVVQSHFISFCILFIFLCFKNGRIMVTLSEASLAVTFSNSMYSLFMIIFSQISKYFRFYVMIIIYYIMKNYLICNSYIIHVYCAYNVHVLFIIIYNAMIICHQ